MEAEKEGGERCRICFTYRLAETAHLAATGGYDYFGTTLTVSPHKNAEWINQIGSKLADQYGVPFLPSDFKKKEGFKKSTQLSKEYNLYRQNYCGCEFSIWEGATVPSEMEKEKKG
jgi:predicted adenine nucleotide alpha hydrolase (AANH) superfamily ATPase